jgi:hypothetical protein
MDSFFRHIPDTLFSPLSGKNREIYARLLVALHPLFFEETQLDLFPSYDTVRARIEEELARFQFQWEDENDNGADNSTPANQPLLAYYRLRDSGWLDDEERDGYKKYVTVPPKVALIWNALVELTRPAEVAYGGMVLSICNNLRSVRSNPEANALAFQQAVSEARWFRQHLVSMGYAIKGLSEELAKEEPRQVLTQFFDKFVRRILAQDYQTLQTQNNPFRFRHEILTEVRELEFDTDQQQRILAGLSAQIGIRDKDSAWDNLLKDIRLLRDIFADIDQYLARIDRYRARLERRTAEVVRYLDRSEPGMANRVVGLLQGLGQALQDRADDDDSLAILPISAPQALSLYSLQTPRAAREAVEPRPLQNRAIDPALLERQKQLREYMNRRRIDPRRIVAYLERHLGEAGQIAAEQLPIASVEDFIAFTHVRHLPYLPGAGRAQRAYRIETSDTWIENEFIKCLSFTVYRR